MKRTCLIVIMLRQSIAEITNDAPNTKIPGYQLAPRRLASWPTLIFPLPIYRLMLLLIHALLLS